MKRPPKPKNTHALRAQKRRKMIAAARQIPAGELRILPLAIVAGVSTVTARKWLTDAGIDLRWCKRGRPKHGESVDVQGVEAILAGAMRQGQVNVDFAAEVDPKGDEPTLLESVREAAEDLAKVGIIGHTELAEFGGDDDGE